MDSLNSAPPMVQLQGLATTPSSVLPLREIGAGIVGWQERWVDVSIKSSRFSLIDLNSKQTQIHEGFASSLIVWDSNDGFSFQGEEEDDFFIGNNGTLIKLAEPREYTPIAIPQFGRTVASQGRRLVGFPAYSKDCNSCIALEDCSTGSLVTTLSKKGTTMTDLAWLDGEHCISLPDSQHSFDLWNLDKGHMATYNLGNHKLSAIASHAKSVFMGTESGLIIRAYGKPKNFSIKGEKEVRALALSRSKPWLLVSGHQGGNVAIWDLRKPQVLKKLPGLAPVHSVQVIDMDSSALIAVQYFEIKQGFNGRTHLWKVS